MSGIPLSIWRDPEFRGLTADAQWLWFVLRTSRIGERKFDPTAVPHLAADMTLARVLDAEVELRRTKYRLALIPRKGRPFIPKSIRQRVYARDLYRCLECGSSERLSLDHIWPYSLGGTDSIDNLRTLCVSCNSRKGARV